MRHVGLSGLIPKKRGRTTVRVPGVRVADDLVKRQFRPDAPNVLWIADITYLRTWEGWLYLAAVQDAYSRRIVGWSMADHMRSELVVHALTMGVGRRRPAPGVIHHSDQAGNTYLLGSGSNAPGRGSPVEGGVERDPIDRRSLGVRRHRVDRPLDDPNYVIGELEFDTTAEAQVCAAASRELWSSAAAAPALAGAPRLRIVEMVEDHAYQT